MRLLRCMLVVTMLVLALDLVPLVVRWGLGINDPNFNNVIRAMQFIFITLLSIVTGFLPAARHPANSAAYRSWLTASPWRAGLPLPMGTVTAGLVEYALLAIYVLIVTLHLHLRFEVPLIGFMLAFAIPSLLTLARTGPAAAPIAMLFVAALFARFFPDMRIALIISAALYVIACSAVERSMRKFPWGMDEVKLPTLALGAVFDRLSPKMPEGRITTKAGIITAAALGWWVYCVMAQPLEGVVATGAFYGLAGLCASVVALGRFVQYGEGYGWPISPWGRIRTRQLIVPGYDYMLITPMCVAAAGWTIPAIAMGAGAPPAVALGLTSSLVVLIALLGPPSLGHWRLTGSHRIALNPPRQNQRKPQPLTNIKLLQKQ